jgi:hypothetical protein
MVVKAIKPQRCGDSSRGAGSSTSSQIGDLWLQPPYSSSRIRKLKIHIWKQLQMILSELFSWCIGTKTAKLLLIKSSIETILHVQIKLPVVSPNQIFCPDEDNLQSWRSSSLWPSSSHIPKSLRARKKTRYDLTDDPGHHSRRGTFYDQVNVRTLNHWCSRPKPFHGGPLTLFPTFYHGSLEAKWAVLKIQRDNQQRQ